MEHPLKNESRNQISVNEHGSVVETTEKFAITSMILIAVYVSAQILADIGSLKVACIAGITVDAGTFLYPITFTVRDMIHKKLGKKTASSIVVTSGIINLVMALFFMFVTILPSDSSWNFQNEWSAILGPVWRIVVASIMAEVVSELLDTEIYHLWVTKVTVKHQWARVLVSNIVSIPVDSIIFALIAFYGTISLDAIFSIIIANVVLKVIITLISIPMIYLVKDEKIEIM